MAIKKMATGIAGLDTMLRGGFPEGRVLLVAGGPGTGKTILCSQFLNFGATRQNEKTVYISLDETKAHYLDEMLTLGWDFGKLHDDGRFVFVDASSVRRIPEGAKVGMANILDIISGLVDLLDIISGARRVVLDSVSGLVFRFPDLWERRNAILNIVEALTNTGATCLITSEVQSIGSEREVQPEEYASHGVVLLETLKTGDRAVRILKMRGTEVDAVPRPYEIRENGIEVYSDQSIY